jgi:hypothetical protein
MHERPRTKKKITSESTFGRSNRFDLSELHNTRFACSVVHFAAICLLLFGATFTTVGLYFKEFRGCSCLGVGEPGHNLLTCALFQDYIQHENDIYIVFSSTFNVKCLNFAYSDIMPIQGYIVSEQVKVSWVYILPKLSILYFLR